MPAGSRYEPLVTDRKPTPLALPAAPSTEELLSHLVEQGGPASRKRAIKTAAEKRRDTFMIQVKAAIDAKGLEPLPPKERLAYYKDLPVDKWLEWQQRFPSGPYGFETVWKDYQELRQRELNGDFND